MIWLPAGGAKSPPSPRRSPAASTTSGWRAGRPTASRPGPWPRPRSRPIAQGRAGAVDDIDLFIPHQANIRIIEAVAKGLGLPMERMFVNLDRYGNTSAASVPIALAEAVDSGRVKVGDSIVIVAFGAGFTSGAVAIEWTADPARGRAADAESAPEDVHVRLPVDWDSVDPIPAALAEILARPGRSRRRRARPRRRRPGRARPARPQPRRRSTHDRPDRQDRRSSPAARAGIGRAIVLRLATQGADVAFSYRGNAGRGRGDRGGGRGARPAGARVQGDVTEPEAGRGASSRRPSRRSARSTSWSTTPASPATT